MGEYDSSVYTICVVQNEADVIGDSLRWASRFSEKIWVWDLGSVDETWEILKGLESPQISVTQQRGITFTKEIRMRMLDAVRSEIPSGAWLYRLDADEFMVGDPRPTLAAAGSADLVRAWQLHFYPTEEDIKRMEKMGEAAWSAEPLFKRLQYYRVGWPEWRFVRVTPELTWTARDGRAKLRGADGRKPRLLRQSLMVLHYQYRSPAQVRKRYETRQASRAAGFKGFRYDRSADFRTFVHPKAELRLWREENAASAVGRRDAIRHRYQRLSSRIRRSPALRWLTKQV